MSLLIAKELNVLDNECIADFSLCCILRAGCIKTNCLVVSYTIAECFDILKFIVDSSLPKTFCPGFANLRNLRTFAVEAPCVPEQSNTRV